MHYPLWCALLRTFHYAILVQSDGTVQAKVPSPFISLDLLKEIVAMKRDGAGSEDVIDRLRLRCVPPGYTPMPWSQGALHSCILNYIFSSLNVLQTCTTIVMLTYTCFGYAERLQETHTDKLRSIVAQLDYSYQVRDYDKKGIPFCTHMYVPEMHPTTGREYHEREDDAHVLKVD